MAGQSATQHSLSDGQSHSIADQAEYLTGDNLHDHIRLQPQISYGPVELVGRPVPERRWAQCVRLECSAFHLDCGFVYRLPGREHVDPTLEVIRASRHFPERV